MILYNTDSLNAERNKRLKNRNRFLKALFQISNAIEKSETATEEKFFTFELSELVHDLRAGNFSPDNYKLG